MSSEKYTKVHPSLSFRQTLTHSIDTVIPWAFPIYRNDTVNGMLYQEVGIA